MVGWVAEEEASASRVLPHSGSLLVSPGLPVGLHAAAFDVRDGAAGYPGEIASVAESGTAIRRTATRNSRSAQRATEAHRRIPI